MVEDTDSGLKALKDAKIWFEDTEIGFEDTRI